MNAAVHLIFGLTVGYCFGRLWAQFLDHTPASSEWLALFGGFIGGAFSVFITIWSANRDRRYRLRDAKEQRKRVQRSARAILALDLSRIMEVATHCARILGECNRLGSLDANSRFPPGEKYQSPDEIPIPYVDREILERLRKNVEILDEHPARQLVDLIITYSNSINHLSGVVDDMRRNVEFPDRERMVIALYAGGASAIVELYLRGNSLLQYALGHTDSIDTPPFDEAWVRHAVELMKIDDWLGASAVTKLIKELTTSKTGGRLVAAT